jgi:hypothetical protein
VKRDFHCDISKLPTQYILSSYFNEWLAMALMIFKIKLTTLTLDIEIELLLIRLTELFYLNVNFEITVAIWCSLNVINIKLLSVIKMRNFRRKIMSWEFWNWRFVIFPSWSNLTSKCMKMSLSLVLRKTIKIAETEHSVGCWFTYKRSSAFHSFHRKVVVMKFKLFSLPLETNSKSGL